MLLILICLQRKKERERESVMKEETINVDINRKVNNEAKIFTHYSNSISRLN